MFQNRNNGFVSPLIIFYRGNIECAAHWHCERKIQICQIFEASRTLGMGATRWDPHHSKNATESILKINENATCYVLTVCAIDFQLIFFGYPHSKLIWIFLRIYIVTPKHDRTFATIFIQIRNVRNKIFDPCLIYQIYMKTGLHIRLYEKSLVS